MATSTEATVRAVIVEAIRGQAANLGFDDPQGNVHEHLLEWEHLDRLSDYLVAPVDGERVGRAVGVQVVGNDDWWSSGNITKRTYEITIDLYFERGLEGEGVNALIEAARHIRNGIRLLGQRLSETVDFVASTGAVRLRPLKGLDASGDYIFGSMTYVAERKNPSF